jgi:hypothetical protein
VLYDPGQGQRLVNQSLERLKSPFGGSEWNAIIGTDGPRQATLLEKALKSSEGMLSPSLSRIPLPALAGGKV